MAVRPAMPSQLLFTLHVNHLEKGSCESTPLASASSCMPPVRGDSPAAEKAMAVLLIPHERMRMAPSCHDTKEPLQQPCLAWVTLTLELAYNICHGWVPVLYGEGLSTIS